MANEKWTVGIKSTRWHNGPRMIEDIGTGFVISEHQVWLPGVYATFDEAERAFDDFVRDPFGRIAAHGTDDMPPEDAQFLETREIQEQEAALLFGAFPQTLGNVIHWPFEIKGARESFLWSLNPVPMREYISLGNFVIHPPFFIEQEIDADGVLHVKIRIPEANPAWDLLKKAVEGDTIEE